MSEEDTGRTDNSRVKITIGGPDGLRGKGAGVPELWLGGSQWRPMSYYLASGDGAEVLEFSLGPKNESKILVDSPEEVSSEKTD